MGCLANAPMPGLLNEPIVEPSPDLSAPDETSFGPEESSLVDLPLWYSVLVAPRTWDEPVENVTTQVPSRLFWRASVAQWPLDRRQRWGDRANELQDDGFGWKDAERVAFEEIMEDLKRRRSLA